VSKNRLVERFSVTGPEGVTVSPPGNPELRDLNERAEHAADILGGLAGTDEAAEALGGAADDQGE
jgi:hypothetical protein